MYRTIVLEDEKLIREWIIFQLERDKDITIIASGDNGDIGMEYIKQYKPDIVVSDINMPKLTAFEMLEKLPSNEFATIIISGYNDFFNAQQAIYYGVCAFVEKPIDECQLVNAIDKAKNQSDKISIFKKKVMSLNGGEILPKVEKNEGILFDVLQYFEENYMEKIQFPVMAKSLGYSESTLYRLFNKASKYQLTELLNRFRIQRSIELYIEKVDTFDILSEQVGFSDYKYFSKVFKKVTGFTPKEYFK